jgi:hypothetical protein
MTKKEELIEAQIKRSIDLQYANNLDTSFDIFEVQDINQNSGLSGDIMVDGVNIVEVKLPKRELTWLELWKYANKLYLKSGDVDHRFIEDFELKEVDGKRYIEVSFGS